MAATSQPLATHAALRAMEDGGNAVDAARRGCGGAVRVRADVDRASAATCFAIVWDGELHGLNASGRAPAAADPDALDRPCRVRARRR